jgi:hypothetical protein
LKSAALSSHGAAIYEHQGPHITTQLEEDRDSSGMKHISSFHYNSRLNNLNGISKPDFDFVLMNYRYLKIIRIQPDQGLNPEVLEWFISQAKEALLSLQKNDKEEKTIVLYVEWDWDLDQWMKTQIITLPWPPALTSKRRSIFPLSL